MEEHKTLVKDVFGESSDSDDEEEQQLQSKDSSNVDPSESIFGESPNWERIEEINGLWLCRDFLSHDQQSLLLSEIEEEGWLVEASHNQAMRFGNLPVWAIKLSNSIREVVLLSGYVLDSMDNSNCNEDKEVCLFPSDLIWREPLFNQLIVNIYQPGEGICAHVDLMRFEDGIAIVSLESSCVMHFSRVEGGALDIGKEYEMGLPLTKIPVYMTPGSLVLMWGEARYLWKHEINRKPGFQKWEGKDIDQKRRTSITLRKLCPTG
ncbi:unnamed protein product [Ilex paraguariensis]|uniref:Fe2OG dioxygenase domain-containing protein n=1 Tax=Ilex paraguariensis TaxID=185542 RepID=A0ABC8U8K2_9AQUA